MATFQLFTKAPGQLPYSGKRSFKKISTAMAAGRRTACANPTWRVAIVDLGTGHEIQMSCATKLDGLGRTKRRAPKRRRK